MFHKTGKTQVQQYWNLVLNCSGEPGGKIRLGPFNNEVGLQVLTFLMTDLLEREIMLMYTVSLYMMIIPWLSFNSFEC